ncbi:MAG: elongation factor P [Alphaproteobacteria bacterium]|nr:elongation factor P [Alphaproteobacteria bacterium]
MKVNAITLRAGNVIEYNGKLCVVVKNDIQQPGKGASVAQIEMRDIRTGNKDNARFRTQETIERIRLEQEKYQCLYFAGDDIVLMNNETYDQITVNKEQMGPQAAYLQDGMIIEVESFEGEPLGFAMPDRIVMQIVEAEPVVKGQTATTSYKPAVLENGEKVMVPPHIGSGTKIIVKLEDGVGTYVERYKG